MPAYNFMERFAYMVECGAKRQTIRPQRKRPTRPGDILIMYTGMRTKKTRNLGDYWCKAVTPIRILDAGIELAGELLDPGQADDVARADGFADAYELTRFMCSRYGKLPIDLVMIEWEHLVRSTVDLGYAYMRAYHPREDRTMIPRGTLGRILDYTVIGNAWNDISIKVEFAGYLPRTVHPPSIQSVYAPEARWPADPHIGPIKIGTLYKKI